MLRKKILRCINVEPTFSQKTINFFQLKLNPDQIYHVYNRGNNRQPIFLEKDNYDYFLRKVETFMVPYCEILEFVLMPNHFHFLITPNKWSNVPYKPSHQFGRSKSKSPVHLTLFSRGLQQTLCTYARGINKRFNRSGSLFQQNTKIKLVSFDSHMEDYALTCFKYIHNNPVMAGLVEKPEDYPYSSYQDYLSDNPKTLCNVELGRKMLRMDINDLFDLTPNDSWDNLI